MRGKGELHYLLLAWIWTSVAIIATALLGTVMIAILAGSGGA